MHPLLFHLLLAALSLLPQATLASVLAIDYGTDWIKASLMKPGVPFDVLLNKDSKRKIQSSVGWKRNDRLFGTDAFNLVSLFFCVSVDSLQPRSLLYRLQDSQPILFRTLNISRRLHMNLRPYPSSPQYLPLKLSKRLGKLRLCDAQTAQNGLRRNSWQCNLHM
jgi:hypothetical protein